MARRKLAERKASKLADLERIKAEIAEIERRAAERIGKLAIAAGLGDLDISDAELKKEFEAIASKFSSKSESQQAAQNSTAFSSN